MRGTASVPSTLYLNASGGPDYSFRYGPVFTGQNGPNSYITVQANPTWWLSEATAGVGNIDSSMLPIRWFVAQNNETADSSGPAYEELQVPNLQQIIFDDQLENVVPTLQVQLYNINTAAYGGGPLPSGGVTPAPGGPYTQTVLGDPGYLSFQYGNLNQNLALAQNQNWVLWGQTPNAWFNILREGALLRWYFGYGGLVGGGDNGDLPLTFSEAQDAGCVCLNGLYMVDSVQIESQTGLITLTCRGAGGKLLQDQLLYPPVVPQGLYSSSGIEFYPPTPIQYQAYVGFGAPGEQAPTNPITTQMSKDGFYKSIMSALVAPDGEGYLLAGTNGLTFGYTGTQFGYGGIPQAGDAGSIKLPAPIIGIAVAGGTSVVTGGSGEGYWLCDQLGNVYGFGSVTGSVGNYTNPSIPNAQLANKQGYSNTLPATALSATNNTVTNPVVGFAAFPNGNGFWMCTSDGHTYAFYESNGVSGGAAPPAFGVPSLSSTQSVVSFALTPNGTGCFMLIFDTSDNATSVFATGVDAANTALTTHSLSGGTTQTFPGAIASSATGDGYWIAYNSASAAEGTVSYAAYGDAEFYTQKTGSWPATLNAPASAIIVRPQNDGLWVVCQDGGVFTFGNADFYGSMPAAYVYWIPSNYVSPYNTSTFVTPGINPATGKTFALPNNNPEDPSLLAPDYSQLARLVWAWVGGFYPVDGTYATLGDDTGGWVLSGDYTAVSPSSPPPLLGTIFDSGAYNSLGPIDPSTFDKLPALQALQSIAASISFIIRFRYDGGLIWTLPNWFAQGNFMEDDDYAWVGGSSDMITFGDGGYPIQDMTLTSTDAPLRSQILVSPIDPAIYDNSPAFPNANPIPAGITNTVTNLTAPSGTMSLLHGINKTALIGVPLNVAITPGDQNLMAEFQALQCWLAARTTTIVSVYDPRVTPDTQIIAVERATGNTDVQYVTGVHVEHDLDQGGCEATYTTQWMGGSAGPWGLGAEVTDTSYDSNGQAISVQSFSISDALRAAYNAWVTLNPSLKTLTPLLPS